MRRLKLPQLSRLCCVPLVLGGSAGIDVAGSLFEFDGFFFKKFGALNQMGSIPGVQHGRCIAQQAVSLVPLKQSDFQQVSHFSHPTPLLRSLPVTSLLDRAV